MAADSTTNWTPLNPIERRVLGVLVEKQKTTDTYPLTLNSVVTGSNQKSNRDPAMELDELEVEEALGLVQKQLLVTRIVSGRVDKFRHNLYDAWKVNSVEISIVAELLLRGPQTEGELRARASRMEDIADVDALRQALAPLKERGLVVYLTPEGRRGTVLTHGFHEAHELERLRKYHSSQPLDATPEPSTSTPFPTPRPDATAGQFAQLSRSVEELREEVARLSAVVQQLQKELGIGPN